MGDSWSVRIIAPQEALWRSVLEKSPHDVYSTPSWCVAHERTDGGDAVAVLATSGTDFVLVPIIRRPLDGHSWDAISPYGYPGLVASRRDDPALIDDALQATRVLLRDSGCVSMFLRLHPLFDTEEFNSADAVVTHGKTVLVNLESPRDEWWAGVRKGHRQDILRTLQLGVEVRQVRGRDGIDDFVRMYRETMARVSASAYYQVDPTYFSSLASMSEVELRLAYLNDVAIGGAMFSTSVSGGIAQYLYSATADEHLRMQPSKLILTATIDTMRGKGLKWLNLGGGLGGGDDSLFSFKAGFSSESAVFRTARFIINEPRYRSLLKPFAAGQGRDAIVSTAFFPLYREPAAR